MHAEIRIIVAGRFTLQGMRRAFRTASPGFCMQDVNSIEDRPNSVLAEVRIKPDTTCCQRTTYLMPAAQLEITLIGASSVSSTWLTRKRWPSRLGT